MEVEIEGSMYFAGRCTGYDGRAAREWSRGFEETGGGPQGVSIVGRMSSVMLTYFYSGVILRFHPPSSRVGEDTTWYVLPLRLQSRSHSHAL